MKRIISLVIVVCTVFCMTEMLGVKSMAASSSDFIRGEYKDDNVKIEYPQYNSNSLLYRLFVPDDYDETKEYPLVIFLHGLGEVDPNNEEQLTGAYNITNRLIEDDYLKKYPCIILAPQCYGFSEWGIAEPLVMSLINSITEEYSIDRERLYITGLSLGGYGTWDIITRHPDKFAAAAPLCGTINPLFIDIDSLLNTPIWIFHGEYDYPNHSRQVYANIKDAGGQYVKYTEFPREGHSIWGLAYSMNDLYEWMFAQRLGNPVDVKTFDVFDDVAFNSWYYEAVKYTYYENIFKGVTENKFKPDMYMTRAMFVTVLHRIEGEPESKNTNKFIDVADNTWYGKAVKWANEKGIVLGKSETEFAPDEHISREQLMTMMYRYAEYCALDTTERASESEVFDWEMVSDYAKDAVLWTVKEKIVLGKGSGRIAPKDNATRAEVATIIKRFIELKDKQALEK